MAAGTFVDIVILDHLNSKLSHVGDTFRIALDRPILLDGKELVPAGIEGKGEVIHAARARAAGKAGEMILAARTLDWGGRIIKLRAFAFGHSGRSQVTEAFVTGMIAGPVGFLISGGEVDVAAGTQAHAKLAEPIALQMPSGSGGGL